MMERAAPTDRTAGRTNETRRRNVRRTWWDDRYNTEPTNKIIHRTHTPQNSCAACLCTPKACTEWANEPTIDGDKSWHEPTVHPQGLHEGQDEEETREASKRGLMCFRWRVNQGPNPPKNKNRHVHSNRETGGHTHTSEPLLVCNCRRGNYFFRIDPYS